MERIREGDGFVSTKFRITISVCLALVLVLGASVVAFGNTGGSSVYVQYCAGCHGSDGQGTAFGPDIQGESAGEVVEVTRSGDDEMPGFDSSVISDADLEALAAYVAGLPGGGAPGDQYGDNGSEDDGSRDNLSGDDESSDDSSSDDAAASQYSLELICGTVYWASMDDYSNHLLSVDYGIVNNGSGTAHEVEVTSATATNGVTASWFSEREWDEIAPGETVNFTIKWFIPPNVTGFISNLEVCSSCNSDDDSSDDDSSDDGSSDSKSVDKGSKDNGSKDEGSRDEGSRDD